MRPSPHGSMPPPPLGPLPEGDGLRPFWTVALPPSNRDATFFKEARRLVLNQDRGAERRERLVLDNCSTRSVAEEVVRRLGPTRAVFHRRDVHLRAAAALKEGDCVAEGVGAFYQAARKAPSLRCSHAGLGYHDWGLKIGLRLPLGWAKAGRGARARVDR